MNTRGMRTVGALFLVLLFLMGAWAVHPGWSAQAQGKKIQGIVYDCAKPELTIPATVTLTDVHSLANLTAQTSGNTYTFAPPELTPGYYTLKVHSDGYFDEGRAQPFRYDGDSLLQFDYCLTKWQNRTKTVNVLVTETSGTSVTQDLYFQRHVITENAAVNFTNGTPLDYTTLSNKPVVGITLVRWQNLITGGTGKPQPPNEYGILDRDAGTVSVNNATISATLLPVPPMNRSPPYYLNFTYTYSSITSELNYTPVVPGAYTLRKNGVTDWTSQENIDWKIDVNAGTVTVLGNFTWGIDWLNMTWSYTLPIAGASVTLYNTTRAQTIEVKSTDQDGMASIKLWPGSWEVRTSKATYETVVTPFYLSDSQTVRVLLPFGITVSGYASDSEGFIRQGVTAFLYNTNPVIPLAKKVLRATITGPQFAFKAYPGNFKLIVDADWHKANVTDLQVLSSPSAPKTYMLDVSREEKVDTVMTFTPASWNRLYIYQNFSFNRDTIIPGLNPPDLRDAFLQIDYTLGDRDGSLSSAENYTFQKSWTQNGTMNINTDNLLSTNSKAYLANRTSDPNTADTDFAVQTSVDTTGSRDYPLWINATTAYYTHETPYIPFGNPLYYVNFTGLWDTNTTVYRNYTYTLNLPHRYEMTETTKRSPALKMQNFTRIYMDPETGSGSPEADMIVRLSASGTARGRVKGPAGHFQEQNTTLANYSAVVMASFNMTYSADGSTDPIGKITDANFTWQFGTTDATKRYGMDVVYNYTSGGVHQVFLTVREAGGNVTTNHLNITVDDSYPEARIWTNISAGGSTANANNTTIRLNESVLVRLDSLRSVDKTFGSNAGTIAEAHWDYNGDGLEDAPSGKIVNHSFEKPGNYTLQMWVFDSVGHRSANATMKVIVNDTSPPNIDFVIYDKNGNIASPMYEGVPYLFNASRTTDNYDSINNLTFQWDFGDGNTTPPVQGYAGYNVTHTYEVFNTSYKIKLNVTDTGFFQKTPNYKVFEKSIAVAVDTAKRPNLQMKAGSFSANPSNPEEGQDVTITVTVVNEADRGKATNIGVKLFVRTGTTWNDVGVSPRFLNNSVETDNTLNAGQEKQIQFVWKADIQGARSLRVTVSDPEEPNTWTGDNSIESTITVKEASWKLPAIVGAFVFIIFGLPIIYYIIKKYRAGELKFRRRGKGEEEEEAPKKEKEEVEKKEKKRL